MVWYVIGWVYCKFKPWPAPGTMKASNGEALGRNMADAAGMEANAGLPVA